MSQVNFRIDDDVKTDAEALFNRLGVNMSTAIMVFIRQSLAENGIPFRIRAAPQVTDRESFVQTGIDYEDGKWSVRIDEANRIVFRTDDNELVIRSCKGYYEV